MPPTSPAIEEPEPDAGMSSDARDLFESTRHGVITTDEQGRIRALNPAAEAIFGWKASEVAGRPLSDLLPHVEELEGGRAAPVADPAPDASTRRVRRLVGRRRDGTSVTLEVAIAAGRGGDEPALVAAVRDVGERQLADEIQHRTRTMEAVGRLASIASHELNNNLMVITGHCDLARGRFDDPARMERALTEIENAGERMKAYLERLQNLDRTRFEASEMLAPAMAVGRLEDRLQGGLGEGIVLVTDLESETGDVQVDPSAFEALLLALVTNAQEALGDAGSIAVRVYDSQLAEDGIVPGLVAGRYAVIEVEDDGPGMDDEVRTRAFEPFFTTKPKGQSGRRGHGLTSAYIFARQAGGAIFALSRLGTGATIRLYLPVLPSEAPPAGSRPWPAEAPAPLQRGNGETILVVEDQAQVRDIVRDALQAAGYVVLTAAGGPEALALTNAHEGDIHLLLSDIMMPEMNGPEVARRFGKIRADTPVLFMSAYARETLPTDEGGRPAPFLPKPFTPSELAAKVAQVLTKAP